MKKLIHLDLFSGIGGFALAAEMVWGKDIEHVFCDNEPFAQAVLKKHWPNSKIYGDIKTLVPSPADIVTGGFPCQPFSNAGFRRGTQDDRHLWPEMLRVIRLATPHWVIGENVHGLVTWNGGLVLETILSDLEEAGYEAWPFIIPAAGIDAPHQRYRVWIVAHSNSLGCIHRKFEKQPTKTGRPAQRKSGTSGTDLADTDSFDVQRGNFKTSQGWQDKKRPARLRSGTSRRYIEWPAEPRVGRVAHGVPSRVDRIKALGNAIVPQVAAEIMKAIKEVDNSSVESRR